MQVKLLRAPLERQVVRLGARKPIELDERLVLHQRGLAAGCGDEPLPARPVLPPHLRDSCPAAADTASSGHPGTGRAFRLDLQPTPGLPDVRLGTAARAALLTVTLDVPPTLLPAGPEEAPYALLRRGLACSKAMPAVVYEAVERELVGLALERCQGNQVHTSALLGISRNVLGAQLKRFGLLPQRVRAGADDAPGHDAGLGSGGVCAPVHLGAGPTSWLG